MSEGSLGFAFRRLNRFMEMFNSPMNPLSALLVYKAKKSSYKTIIVTDYLFTTDSNNISLVDFRGKFLFSP